MGKKKGAGCVSRKATVRESLQASNRDWGIWRWRIRWSEEEWVEWRKECGSGGIWVEEWEVWEQAWADWRAAMKEMVDAHEALMRRDEMQRPERYYKNHEFRPRQAFTHTQNNHILLGCSRRRRRRRRKRRRQRKWRRRNASFRKNGTSAGAGARVGF